MAAAAASLLMPRLGQEVVLYLAGLLPVVTIVAICLRRPPPGRSGWLAIAGGHGAFLVGDMLWGYYDLVLGVDPFPSVADAWYLAGYPLFAVGLWRLMRTQMSAGDHGDLIDAGIVSVGCGVVTWVFLIVPLATDSSLSLGGRVIAAAYPVADVVLLSLVVRLFLTTGRRSVGLKLLGAAFAVLLVADVLYALEELIGARVLTASNIGFMLAYTLTAAASAHPSRRIPTTQVAASRSLTPLRLILLSLAALLVPGVLAYQTIARLPTDGLVLAIGSAALVMLVVLRLSGLVKKVEQQAAELAALARVDVLTGIGNRRRWDEQLPVELAHAVRTGIPIAVALLDLDHFKAFNDQFGHPAGDELLRAAAAAWQTELRSADLLARYGGEEFAVLLPGCRLDDAAKLVSRLRGAIPLGQTCSAGIAEWDADEDSAALVRRADLALYRAKSKGRDRCELALSLREETAQLQAPTAVDAAL